MSAALKFVEENMDYDFIDDPAWFEVEERPDDWNDEDYTEVAAECNEDERIPT